jgi:hypothetical protein
MKSQEEVEKKGWLVSIYHVEDAQQQQYHSSHHLIALLTAATSQLANINMQVVSSYFSACPKAHHVFITLMFS